MSSVEREECIWHPNSENKGQHIRQIMERTVAYCYAFRKGQPSKWCWEERRRKKKRKKRKGKKERKKESFIVDVLYCHLSLLELDVNRTWEVPMPSWYSTNIIFYSILKYALQTRHTAWCVRYVSGERKFNHRPLLSLKSKLIMFKNVNSSIHLQRVNYGLSGVALSG